MTCIMLVGNPNCGKTTLFNALTGDNQRVGNWPGVTVEKKTGVFRGGDRDIQVTDLPGIYSLVSTPDGSSLDERITAASVAAGQFDVVVNVMDACHFERHLYLTSQLLELGKPMILVLNMADIAKQRGIQLDTLALSRVLGCPVVMLQAHRQIGISELKHAILALPPKGVPLTLSLPPKVCGTLSELAQQLRSAGAFAHDLVHYVATRIMEGDTLLMNQSVLTHDAGSELDIVMADARYQAVHQVTAVVQKKRSDTSDHVTAKLDRIVLHRFFALPIFFAVMYCLFFFAINVGGAFQDFFDIATDAVFVQGSTWLLQQCHMPNGLIALCAQGVGKGINTTLTFIPVIAAMFFFLSLLETSGYMARAAFVVDKAMRVLGLPGKSFVPMIVGFGCNVPAIMAARTLDSEQDRLLTVLMSPFMSCSARLAIYAIFVAAFFPTGGQNVVFSLYLIGILMAVLTGFMLRNTLFRGKASPLILELPAYHWPSLGRLLKETTRRLRYFLTRAGKLILPVCVLLGGLNSLTIHGGLSVADASHDSILSLLGQWLTPLFSPMGLHQDNWPATVGLMTGMLAKEVVVGSLNTLYAQMGSVADTASLSFHMVSSLQEALWSIPHNLAQMGHALVNPLFATTIDGGLSQSIYGVMYQHFDGKAGAYAYMLFILLYIPCVSTMAVIRQEATRQLMWFSILWSLVVAYSVSVVFYQLATLASHPLSSIVWVLGMGLLVACVVMFIHSVAKRSGVPHAVATS